MPLVYVNGIRLNYEEYGSGPPVILIAGSGAPGRVWRPYQVPALTGAGYRVITVDNRGVAPSDIPAGETSAEQLAADIAALADHLGLAPCRIVGYSLGAIIAQELLVARPDLAEQAVLVATRGRTDALAAARSRAESALLHEGARLPPAYEAVVRAMQNLSPRTLRDQSSVGDWLDLFEVSGPDPVSARAHIGAELIPDRRESYRQIRVSCLVLAFGDDLITPPWMCQEVAQSIPGSTYYEIPGCGHLGYLEDPAQLNLLIVNYFRGAGYSRLNHVARASLTVAATDTMRKAQ